MDTNNKLSVASDHSYTRFNRTLTSETGTLTDTSSNASAKMPVQLEIDSVDLSLSISFNSSAI